MAKNKNEDEYEDGETLEYFIEKAKGKAPKAKPADKKPPKDPNPLGDEYVFEKTCHSPEIHAIMKDGVKLGTVVRLESGKWIATWYNPNHRSGRACHSDSRIAAAAAKINSEELI